MIMFDYMISDIPWLAELLKNGYYNKENVNNSLFILSVYMGHKKPEDTYWYLSATPELLNIATEKYEEYFGGFDYE